VPLPVDGLTAPDSIEDWAGRYLDAAVRGVRSTEVADRKGRVLVQALPDLPLKVSRFEANLRTWN